MCSNGNKTLDVVSASEMKSNNTVSMQQAAYHIGPGTRVYIMKIIDKNKARLLWTPPL
jgi:hypothetical protein